MAKRTYTMPDEIANDFEAAVLPGERSKVIAKLVQHWLDEKRSQALRADIVEGCHQMGAVYLETVAEWSTADDEVWRAL